MVTTVVKTIGPGGDYADDVAWAAAGPKDCTVNINLTALSGATTTVIPLDSTASSTTGAYVGNTMTIGAETRLITAYNATTKTATVGALNGSAAAFSSAPATGAAVNIGQVTWEGQLAKTKISRAVSNTISGKVTSATCKYRLRTAPGASVFDAAAPDTVPLRIDPTYATIEITSGSTIGIDAQIDYFEFDGIQMKYSGSDATGVALIKSTVGNPVNRVWKRFILEGTCNNSAARGVALFAGDTIADFLIANTTQNDAAAVIAEINSATKALNGFLAATGGTKLTAALACRYVASTFKNVAVMGCLAVNTDALAHTIVNCFTDGTQSGWTKIAYDNTVFAKVASDGTHDFRLTSTSPLKDAGATLTGSDATYTSTDAYGRARPQGAAWDVGPTEYVAPAATPVTFSGPVPTRNGAVGVAASFPNAGFFAGNATPFTYSLQAGVLPAGLTLSASTGIISGTPTVAGTQSGIVVRATDANNATADTNAYSIVIASSNAAPTFTGTIANITGTVGTAITPVNVAGQFTDTDALTFSASPAGTAWPAGISISSAGVISGTPTAAATTSGLKVRATDTAGQTVDSNAFSVTASAAQTAGTITWPYPIAPVNGDARLSAGHRIAVCNMTTDALVVRKTGLTTSSTTGVPPAISDAAIVAGTQYRCHLILDNDNAASGTEVITAT